MIQLPLTLLQPINLSWGCEVPKEKPREETKEELKDEEEEENECPIVTSFYQVDMGLGSRGGYVIQGGTVSLMIIANDPEGDNIYYRYYGGTMGEFDSGIIEDPYWSFVAPDYPTTLNFEIVVVDDLDDQGNCDIQRPNLKIIVQRVFLD